MPRFAPRIHVLLASRAPVGLVIRRGPSKSVATLLWDRRRDEFHLGQWLKGRIYERRSDLSPDGKYVIYFAMNGKWNSEALGSWTAISRAPYLKAIGLFPKGDCYNGGGLWTGSRSYWLNDGPYGGHSVLRNTTVVCRDENYEPSANYGPECLGVYYRRLLRDGWTLVERIRLTRPRRRPKGIRDILERPLPRGWRLRKVVHIGGEKDEGRGVYWDRHEIISPDTESTIACPNWEWADRDGKRVVWAAKGKLWAAEMEKSGLVDQIELCDFNEMKFEAIEAPY